MALTPVSEAENAQLNQSGPAAQAAPASPETPETPAAPATPAEKPQEPAAPNAAVPATPETPPEPGSPLESAASTAAEISEYQKNIEVEMLEMTGGKARNWEEHKAYLKELEEKASKKPVFDSSTLMSIADKIKEEKGFTLEEALHWSKVDISKMSDKEKLEFSIRASLSAQDEPEKFIQNEINKFKILDDPNLAEMIEDDDISQETVDKLTLERDRIIHKSEKTLSEYKKKFDLSVNFDAPTPRQSGPTQEQIDQGKRSMSEAITSLDKTSVQIDLPLELGILNIDIPVTDSDKHSLIPYLEPGAFNKQRYFPKGEFDFKSFSEDMHLIKNKENIFKMIATNAANSAVAAYQKTLENFRQEKPPVPGTPKGQSLGRQAGASLSEAQRR